MCPRHAMYTPVRKVFAEGQVLWRCLGGKVGTGTRICVYFELKRLFWYFSCHQDFATVSVLPRKLCEREYTTGHLILIPQHVSVAVLLAQMQHATEDPRRWCIFTSHDTATGTVRVLYTPRYGNQVNTSVPGPSISEQQRFIQL